MMGPLGWGRNRWWWLVALVVAGGVLACAWSLGVGTGTSPAAGRTRPSSHARPRIQFDSGDTVVPAADEHQPVAPVVPVTPVPGIQATASTTAVQNPVAPPPRPSQVASAPAAPVTTTTEPGRIAASLILAIDARSSVRAVPETATNIALLERWMANEGGLWANNPLNTSLGSASHPHQITTSGVDTGIPVFPTMADGIQAVAVTLISNPSYSRILTVLHAGAAPCRAFAAAVIRSPWASSHYGFDLSRFCSGKVRPLTHGPYKAR